MCTGEEFSLVFPPSFFCFLCLPASLPPSFPSIFISLSFWKDRFVYLAFWVDHFFFKHFKDTPFSFVLHSFSRSLQTFWDFKWIACFSTSKTFLIRATVFISTLVQLLNSCLFFAFASWSFILHDLIRVWPETQEKPFADFLNFLYLSPSFFEIPSGVSLSSFSLYHSLKSASKQKAKADVGLTSFCPLSQKPQSYTACCQTPGNSYFLYFVWCFSCWLWDGKSVRTYSIMAIANSFLPFYLLR